MGSPGMPPPRGGTSVRLRPNGSDGDDMWAAAPPGRDDVAHARDAARRTQLLDGRPPGRRPRPRSPLQRFVDTWGWRAYALPILVVVTIVALLTTKGASPVGHPTARPPAVPPPASAHVSLGSDSSAGQVDDAVLRAAALPAGPAYDVRGDGTFRVLRGTSPKVGHGRLFRYSIDAENGLTGVDLGQFQRMVVRTLSDHRSWSGHGVALERVDSGPIDFHVTMTTSLTVRKLCGYTIPVETSCYAADDPLDGLNRVVINDARWERGSAAYVGDPDAYRTYMINHEDGHALGHEHAHQCLPGGLAPTMMQQTFGLRSAATGKMCQANPWPYPPGARGAPGAEQPDTAANDEYGLAD